MGERTVAVFCDGSLTNSVLSDVFTSTLAEEYVGRAMVIVPAQNIGMIRQTREGMLTPRGTPASNEAEVFAIRSALDFCGVQRLTDYIVYSDCRGAVDRFRDHPVEWRSRQELRLPNDFFDKVLRRASICGPRVERCRDDARRSRIRLKRSSSSIRRTESSTSARALSGNGSAEIPFGIRERSACDLGVPHPLRRCRRSHLGLSPNAGSMRDPLMATAGSGRWSGGDP